MGWPFLPPLLRHRPRAPTPRVLQRWLLSPASRPDASGAPGHGKCSAHDRQRSPSSVHVNARGFDFPRIVSAFTTMPACLGGSGAGDTGGTGALAAADRAHPPSSRLLMSPARLAPLLAPQLSPRAELFGCCVDAGVVGRVHSHFIIVTHRHCPVPPQQCDLSRRTRHRCCYRHRHRHRHCGHYHQGATQPWTQPRTQPTGQRHRAASHTVIAPPRAGNATSRVAVAAAAVVAIAIATATVATTTKATDAAHGSDIALPEVPEA